MNDRQPMAGKRRKVLDPAAAFETPAFAKRRTKNRKRGRLAKASRAKNR